MSYFSFSINSRSRVGARQNRLWHVRETMECTNSSIPLAFDLFETWAEASSLTSFALDATLGTPPQKIVLYPANTQYDVFVYNTSIEYTPPSSLEPFDMEALGYYNSTKSSTYTSTSLKDWNGTQKTYDPTLFDFFQDTLGVGNNLSVDGFPILGSATEEGVRKYPSQRHYTTVTDEAKRSIASR